MTVLVAITVSIDDLLLDPNNPRLVTGVTVADHVPDGVVESRQSALLAFFDERGRAGCFDIQDLYESMRLLGYVGIDRIVVRKLSGSPKFLVIEGNRRVATIKKILNEESAAREDKRLSPWIAESFAKLEVMMLDATDMSREDLEHQISIILGLRHHGSLLEWDPLPAAFNIYSNYMSAHPALEGFRVENKRVKDVAKMLSVQARIVRRALQTYQAYLQLSESTRIGERSYSLVEAAVTNTKLVGNEYFKVDQSTYRLTEDSVERLDRVCQFDARGSLEPGQIIIPKPQDFLKVAYIVDRSKNAADRGTRDFATGLLARLEAGEQDPNNGLLQLSLQAAADELRAHEQRSSWVPALNDLLKKQQNELAIGDYAGIGNDRLRKDEVKTLLRRFQILADSL